MVATGVLALYGCLLQQTLKVGMPQMRHPKHSCTRVEKLQQPCLPPGLWKLICQRHTAYAVGKQQNVSCVTITMVQ